MKILLFVLITCCLSMGKISAKAQIKPYIAIINTGDDIFKGVLYTVTPDSIGVKRDASVVFFHAADIKNIKLKEIKRGFRYKKYLSYDPYNEKNYQKLSNKMVPVRKWGEQDKTIEEELSCRIITSFYNTAMNSVFASIGLVSGSTSNVKVNYDVKKYQESVQSLAYHSIAYQTNADAVSSAQALKASLNNKGN